MPALKKRSFVSLWFFGYKVSWIHFKVMWMKGRNFCWRECPIKIENSWIGCVNLYVSEWWWGEKSLAEKRWTFQFGLVVCMKIRHTCRENIWFSSNICCLFLLSSLVSGFLWHAETKWEEGREWEKILWGQGSRVWRLMCVSFEALTHRQTLNF